MLFILLLLFKAYIQQYKYISTTNLCDNRYILAGSSDEKSPDFWKLNPLLEKKILLASIGENNILINDRLYSLEGDCLLVQNEITVVGGMITFTDAQFDKLHWLKVYKRNLIPEMLSTKPDCSKEILSLIQNNHTSSTDHIIPDEKIDESVWIFQNPTNKLTENIRIGIPLVKKSSFSKEVQYIGDITCVSFNKYSEITKIQIPLSCVRYAFGISLKFKNIKYLSEYIDQLPVDIQMYKKFIRKVWMFEDRMYLDGLEAMDIDKYILVDKNERLVPISALKNNGKFTFKSTIRVIEYFFNRVFIEETAKRLSRSLAKLEAFMDNSKNIYHLHDAIDNYFLRMVDNTLDDSERMIQLHNVLRFEHNIMKGLYDLGKSAEIKNIPFVISESRLNMFLSTLNNFEDLGYTQQLAARKITRLERLSSSIVIQTCVILISYFVIV